MNPTLDAIPLWGILAGSVAVLALADYLGACLGRVWGTRVAQPADVTIGGVVTAELGLLAFLLAFTFGIAATRFEERRTVLLDEANAIGTTYLRTAMVPEPHRVEIRAWLLEYVDVRLAAARHEVSAAEAIVRSEELHEKLWAKAVAASEQDPRSVPIGLFVEALNETIDLHTKRVTANLRSRIPLAVWIVLGAVAMLSFGSMGFQGGLAKSRRSPAVLVLAITFASVVWLVADLDRPGQGILRLSQQPMIDLRQSMVKSGG